MRKYWTEEERKLLADYINSGLRYNEIADKLERSYDSIEQQTRLMGLSGKKSVISYDDKKAMAEMRNNGIKISEIAQKFNISDSYAIKILKEMKIDKFYSKKFWTDEKIKELESLIHAKWSIKKISNKIGKTENQVKKQMYTLYGTYKLEKIRRFLETGIDI